MENKKKQILLIFISSIVLGLIASRFIGEIAYKLAKPVIGLGPQASCPECFDGFILVYVFFIVLLFSLFSLLKWKYSLLFLLPLVLFINPPFEFLIMAAILMVIAFVLAQLILFIQKQLKK